MLPVGNHPGERELTVPMTDDGFIEFAIEDTRASTHPDEARELITHIERAITEVVS